MSILPSSPPAVCSVSFWCNQTVKEDKECSGQDSFPTSSRLEPSLQAEGTLVLGLIDQTMLVLVPFLFLEEVERMEVETVKAPGKLANPESR